jgi:S-adenosylmethionine decarboxylase
MDRVTAPLDLLAAANRPSPFGRQVMAELMGCDPVLLADHAAVERLMNEAALAAGATIVQSAFHTFNPYGVSGVVIIAESHLAIHTWPEHGYAAVDVFTCGTSVDPGLAVEALAGSLKAAQTRITTVRRGPDGGPSCASSPSA